METFVEAMCILLLCEAARRLVHLSDSLTPFKGRNKLVKTTR